MINSSNISLHCTSANTQIINMQDVIGNIQEQWMLGILVCAAYFFIYAIFNNFILIKSDSKYFWLVDAMHEWAIIPACYLLILAITYFTGYKGI